MTPDDIIKLLDATCICGARKLHDPIQHAFAADLMSDVLRLNTEGLLLITGMANPQVIRTAEMADIPFILFVRADHGRNATAGRGKRNPAIALPSKYVQGMRRIV